jgi:hypothetical protein
MTETLHLGRMRVRYRVARDEPALRRRLDHLLRGVLDDGLEPALARSRVPVDEEICIRFVHSAVRIRPDAGDSAAVAAWSAAIADALGTALAARSDDVIRYRTRRAALVDLALGVAAGDRRRSWAWRQLGLWHAPDAAGDEEAVAELVAALVREPEAIVSVLAEVARSHGLTRLLASMRPDAWTALARLAFEAAGGRAPAAPPSAATADDELVRRSNGILAASALGRAALSTPLRLGQVLLDDVRSALAALAWLEAEPTAAATSSPAAAEALVAAAAEALAGATPPASGDGAGDAELPETTAPADGRPPEPPQRWTTRHAGLLFLLGVADELDLPDELTTVEPLAHRQLTWTLHRLGLEITRAEHDDPGVLAFAGLPPDAQPPDGDAPAPAELAALGALAGRVAERVRERLGGWKTPPDELLDFVCRRRGEIVFDPGWLEVRLPSEEVSVDLRRAGLDLDPGWLPWLGAVVRFAYV